MDTTLKDQEVKRFEALRDLAISMGRQIGGSIREDNPLGGDTKLTDEDRRQNCRRGRKYIIRLGKANQFDSFLRQLGKIMMRYGLKYDGKFLQTIDPQSFMWFKEFMLIAALTIINTALSSKSDDSKTKTHENE
jgi:hypothetical protein